MRSDDIDDDDMDDDDMDDDDIDDDIDDDDIDDEMDDDTGDATSHAKDGIELDEAQVPSAGGVRRVGDWAVGRSKGDVFAVSRRCRHQLADLSRGTVDADGCLVCPWHQSRYDVRTGAMVSGPKGFLGYHGRTPGYTGFVLAYGRILKLRVATVVREAGHRLLIR